MKNTNSTEKDQNNSSTRQKILYTAANMFAAKGYSETSLRELSAAVGIKAASIYNHFPSKNAILEEMLEDYSVNTNRAFLGLNFQSILKENPTPDGILNCMQLFFPEGKVEHYLNVLSVVMQEQHRNPLARRTAEQMILNTQINTINIIDTLKEIGVIQRDTDPDYWMKVCSSLFYTFASRMTLGIGDSEPDFTGKGMIEMLKTTFDMLFEKHGVH